MDGDEDPVIPIENPRGGSEVVVERVELALLGRIVHLGRCVREKNH